MAELGGMVRDLFGRIEARDFAGVRHAIADDCDFVAPGFSGRSGDSVVEWLQPFLSAFPDLRHEAGLLVQSGDSVAFELRLRGTHTEPLVGPGGEFPPTERALRLPAASLWRVADGRIVAYHVFFDQLDLFSQLGLSAGPAQAGGPPPGA